MSCISDHFSFFMSEFETTWSMPLQKMGLNLTTRCLMAPTTQQTWTIMTTKSLRVQHTCRPHQKLTGETMAYKVAFPYAMKPFQQKQ